MPAPCVCASFKLPASPSDMRGGLQGEPVLSAGGNPRRSGSAAWKAIAKQEVCSVEAIAGFLCKLDQPLGSFRKKEPCRERRSLQFGLGSNLFLRVFGNSLMATRWGRLLKPSPFHFALLPSFMQKRRFIHSVFVSP